MVNLSMRSVSSNRTAPYDFVRRTLATGVEASMAQQVRELLMLGGVDWEETAALASKECVAPALFPVLRDSQLIQDLPADFTLFLEVVNELNRIRNIEFFAETELIAQLLNRRGIEPILLKGIAYLFIGAYKDSGSRFLTDIDMLLSKDQLAEAIETLRDHGFEPRATLDPVHHHYCPMSRTIESPLIELHEGFTTRGRGALLQPEEVIGSSELMVVNGSRFRIPSAEHLLLHLILHAENDEGPRLWIWPPLRPLLDFAMLLRAFPNQFDWSRLRSKFEVAGCEHVLQLFCLAADEVLGLSLVPNLAPERVPFQWFRSRALRKFPALRLIDLEYMATISIAPRLRRVKLFFHLKGGLRYLIRRTLRPTLLRDIIRDAIRRR